MNPTRIPVRLQHDYEKKVPIPCLQGSPEDRQHADLVLLYVSIGRKARPAGLNLQE